MLCRCLLGLLLFGAVIGPVQAEAREEIEGIYQRTYRAAALKYRSGMYAHRAGNFRALDRDGVLVDPRQELAWLNQFLGSALTVEEKGEIVRFDYLSEDEVECEVLDTIEAETFTDVQKKTLQKVKIVTRSRDGWRRTGSGWKQTSCRLLDQTYSARPKGAR